MRKALIATMMASTLVTGCNFAPQYRRPVAVVGTNFPAVDSVQGQSAAALDWRDYFADPALRRRIDAALENNRDLAQSVARIAQARARFRIQDSQRLPEIGGTASAARTRVPLGTVGFGDALGGGTVTFDQFSIGVAVTSFEIDFWGRVRNLSDAARGEYLATVEGTRAFRLTLIAQVATTWFEIRAGEERIALADRSIANRAQGTRIAKARLDGGLTSTADYDQAVTLLTQAQAERAELERTTGQARNLLDVLTGGPVPDPAPTRLATPEDAVQVRPLDPGLPSDLLANRPDIIAAELRLRAANANIGAARAAFFPTVSLTGSFGFAASALGDVLKSGSQNWSFGSGVALPIFDFGRRDADLNLAQAQADELIAGYQRTVQGAFREVADALVARRAFASQIDAQTRTLVAQRRLAEVARKRYANGISRYLDVLDAERSLFVAEQAMVQLRAAELQNAVSLYTALGGGTKVPRPAQ